jgi:hypothetical protein
MGIRSVVPNNRRKAFEVTLSDGRTLDYPYARLSVQPGRSRRLDQVFVDAELGNEAFTYRLSSGEENSIHVEQVLEYNSDPDYLKDMVLYELTLEAQQRVARSALSKREIIRRLGTSATQFYRLLDQTNYSKSIGQLLALLEVLDCEVELIVRDKPGALSPEDRSRRKKRAGS